jgi:hypothetical protein
MPGQCKTLKLQRHVFHQAQIKEVTMKRFIISTFIVSLLSLSLSPAIAAPGDHNLKTKQGVEKLYEEIQSNSGGQ